MKTYIKIIASFLIVILSSCEDVIDVDLQSAEERLVVEASIDWDKETSGANQMIKLTMSSPYFDDGITERNVLGASVKITNNNSGAEFVFEDQNNGEYTVSDFIPEVGSQYTLEIIYNGETYVGIETMSSVTDIVELSQGTRDDFGGGQEIEVNVVFDDPAEEENFYLFRFQKKGNELPQLEDVTDNFINGNRIVWEYADNYDDDDEADGLQPGDVVDIEFFGISEAYYNYISILINQNSSGGPFSSTPVALKGNCINTTNPDNSAYGYFRLTQVNKATYTVE